MGTDSNIQAGQLSSNKVGGVAAFLDQAKWFLDELEEKSKREDKLMNPVLLEELPEDFELAPTSQHNESHSR